MNNNVTVFDKLLKRKKKHTTDYDDVQIPRGRFGGWRGYYR